MGNRSRTEIVGNILNAANGGENQDKNYVLAIICSYDKYNNSFENHGIMFSLLHIQTLLLLT
jgi:hypothetical protein